MTGIAVYNGPGISPLCFESMKRELESELDSSYHVFEFNKTYADECESEQIEALFIPAGHALSIAEGLQEVSSSIQELISSHTVALYASGGGAIAVARNFSQLFSERESKIGSLTKNNLDLNPFDTKAPYHVVSNKEEYNYLTVEVKLSPNYLQTKEKTARLFYALGPCFDSASAGSDGQEIARYKVGANNQVKCIPSATVLHDSEHRKPMIFDGVIPFIGLEDIDHSEVKFKLKADMDTTPIENLKKGLEQGEQVRHEVIRAHLGTLGLKVKPKPRSL